MKTPCKAKKIEFKGLNKRKVVAAFDGGHISSDGGALLLRALDQHLGLTHKLAECFTDHRQQGLIEHTLEELVAQRVFGIALGYEDLNDHNELSLDPLLALCCGKVDVEAKERTNKHAREQGKALASSSTLNRLELTPEDATQQDRYKKIVYHREQIESLFVEQFLNAYDAPPEEIVLDFDATDDIIHGNQEGRFYHGYYGNYCYLPLYVFCNKHLLAAKLRTSDKDGADGTEELLAFLVKRIRERWPDTRIVLRGDSGFCRESIMRWCEQNDVRYLLGLAQNKRLRKQIARQMQKAKQCNEHTGHAERVFTEFRYRTLKSWTRPRRVIGKAEHLDKGANPRFIVTNIPGSEIQSRALYEEHYCARGEMENRIKEAQMDLFADRTSANTMRANQLRLWFSAAAYVLLDSIRRHTLKNTSLAKATCGSIRLKLLKIGAQLKISVRRFTISLASACPYQKIFHHVLNALQDMPLRC